jgi:hemerythrin-like metal-binding protein
MALINWSDEFSVGINVFDEHHKKLAGLVNQLHDAMKRGEAKQMQEAILDELVKYTRNHFFEEERMFDLYSYPEAILHKREHSLLTAKVVEYSNSVKSGKSIISSELMNFLRDWLLNHIANSDKKYSDFFKAKGVK